MNVRSNTKPKAASVASQGVSPFRQLLLTFWFVLIIVAFWGPVFNLPLNPAVETGLYGIFVLIAAAAGALKLVRWIKETPHAE